MTRIPPIDQANLLAGHAVSCATAFLDGRHDAARLADSADRIFRGLQAAETAETSNFLIPVQLLVTTMRHAAKHAGAEPRAPIPTADERGERWQQIMAALVELVMHESRQLKKD